VKRGGSGDVGRYAPEALSMRSLALAEGEDVGVLCAIERVAVAVAVAVLEGLEVRGGVERVGVLDELADRRSLQRRPGCANVGEGDPVGLAGGLQILRINSCAVRVPAINAASLRCLVPKSELKRSESACCALVSVGG
jgi:hypothetical protein